MFEIISGLLLLFGSFFCLVASLGMLRLPDLLTRMHAASKAGSVGIVSLFLSIGLISDDTSIIARVVIGISFLLITIPVSAHLLARSSHISGAHIWIGTAFDEYLKHRLSFSSEKKK